MDSQQGGNLGTSPECGEIPLDLSTGSGLGAILLWSATFAFARSLSEQVGPLTGGAVAYLIGGCVYLGVSPGPKLWIGCLLLVAGSLMTWRSVSDRPVPKCQGRWVP